MQKGIAKKSKGKLKWNSEKYPINAKEVKKREEEINKNRRDKIK